MRVTGKVAKVDHRSGDFTREGTGEVIAYDLTVVSLLIDGLDIVEVKVKSDQRQQLGTVKRGDDVTFEVDVPKGTKLLFSERVNAPAAVRAS